MNKIATILISIIIIFSGLSMHAQVWYDASITTDQNKFSAVQEKFNEIYQNSPDKKVSCWKQFKRWEYFWSKRLDENGNIPDATRLFNEVDKFNSKKKHDAILSINSDWKPAGPFNVPLKKDGNPTGGIGRVNDVAFHHEKPGHLWVASAGGGIWHSPNNAEDWYPVSGTELYSMGVTDIEIAKSNSDIFYATTGDAYGWNMSQSFSIGLIKSTDGGQTWFRTALTSELTDRSLQTKLIIHPTDPDIVLVGSSNGLYKTVDGGETWQVKSGVSGFVRDLEFNTATPSVIICSAYSNGNSAIYRSADMGETWEEAESVPGCNRIELAVTQSHSSYAYAVCSRYEVNDLLAFLRSTDQGRSWKIVSTEPNILSRDTKGTPGVGQGQYDLAIITEPADKDVVYVAGINTWKTTNGGKDWELNNHWTGGGGKPFVHADHHDLEINLAENVIYTCNDGGIARSTDNGLSWQHISDALNILQLYRFGLSALDSNVWVTGSQDNAVHKHDNGTWTKIYGSDGMECLIDYADSNYIYAENYYGAIGRSKNGGQNFKGILNQNKTGEQGNWVTPFIIDPNNHKKLYAGFQNVWRTYNQGDNWEKISEFNSEFTLEALAVAHTDTNCIYAANRNSVYATFDGGESWEKILSSYNQPSYIAVDHEDPRKIFVAFTGYSPDEKLKVYENGEWTNHSFDLPNVSINCVIQQANTGGRLFVATDIGVLYFEPQSKSWNWFNTGMPRIVVMEIEIHYESMKLFAATFGRGVWKTKISDCEIEQVMIEKDNKIILCQGDSVTLSANNDYPNYLWNSGENTKSITVYDNGKFYVTVENEAGCISKSNTVNVHFNPLPKLEISVKGDLPFCEGDSVKLSANLGFATYNWSNGASGRSIYVKNGGLYSVLGTTNESCTNESEVEVTMAPKPVITRFRNLLVSSEGLEYQWYKDGEKIEGAVSKELSITETGEYTVEVLDEFGCRTFSEIFDVISSVDDLQISKDDLLIIPNPNSGSFQLQTLYLTSELITVSISDLLGKTLFEYTYAPSGKSFDEKIDLTGQDAGMYFVKFQQGRRTLVKKLLIE